jgi:hypothetical protein
MTLAVSLSVLVGHEAAAQTLEAVKAIAAPLSPLPTEAASRDVSKFAFIAYGDTRGRRDGTAVQYEHSLIMDSMLARIKKAATTEYPIKFVLQSGDAVVNGRDAKQWNISFIPVIERLTKEADVPYFLTPGNHEATTTEAGMRNYLDAVSALIPSESSPRRLRESATYSFAYGNTFVVALDANVAENQKQFQWVKSQLEGLDRRRYVNIIVFCHQAPFSSGPHGGANVEPPTAALRSLYMPLFNTHHVRVVFAGHEHLFEHWVEHYSDATGPHRMDLVVSGGGGAPLYRYTGEPNLRDYLEANESMKVRLEHLVKPGAEPGSNPYHYVVVNVDGEKVDMEVVAVDWGSGFQPYGSNKVQLVDAPR